MSLEGPKKFAEHSGQSVDGMLYMVVGEKKPMFQSDRLISCISSVASDLHIATQTVNESELSDFTQTLQEDIYNRASDAMAIAAIGLAPDELVSLRSSLRNVGYGKGIVIFDPSEDHKRQGEDILQHLQWYSRHKSIIY